MMRDWAPAYAGATKVIAGATKVIAGATKRFAPAAFTSHPRRRVSNFFFILLIALFSTQAAAFSIQVPDFNKLERQLRIRPAQKAQFDAAVEATQRALMSVAIAGMQVKERLSAEIAKPMPDLNAIYRLHEEAIELAAPNFRDARREWERLYGVLDRSQLDAAKRFLQQELGTYFPGLT